MKPLFIILFILVSSLSSYSQGQNLTVSLEDVLEMARQNSLEAHKSKNVYLAGYWEYQSFKARQLPHVRLRLDPSTYNRMMTKRYDFENDLEVYREQQTLSSYSNLSLSQNIPLTGGRVYFDSDFSRLVNYGDDKFTTYSVTPIRIGLVQPLFGFNSLKWEKELSPLKYAKSQQEYVQNVQGTNLHAVNLFFDLILASKRKEIVQKNVATADTLLRVGKMRFEIASIQREELLDLELSKFNAEIDLAQAEKELEKSKFSLNSFLGLNELAELSPVIPPIIKGLTINIAEAVELARKNNPEILLLDQKQLEAEKNLDQATRENRFSANVQASYGLNQQAEEIHNAYKDPLSQQMVMLSLDIPIVDWGDGKGKKQMAQKNKEVVEIEVQQAQIDFKQKIALKIIDFNLQEKQVASAAKAEQIAQNSFELTKRRYLLGKADVLKLNSAMQASQRATEKYINSLYTFWKYFYEVQQLTLYDFRSGKTLVENFEDIEN